MAFELILQDIELADNTINDNTFDIWFCKRLNRFLAQENIKGGRKFVYELKDSEENIATNHRQEILEYCLAVILPNESVGLGDIFVHGKYIKKLY